MASLDDLPDLPTPAFLLILALLVVFWVHMKVKLLRERIALRGAQEALPEARRWQHALARARATGPVLGGLALVLLAALAWTMFF